MLLFGKFNLNQDLQNASLKYSGRSPRNWFREIGYRELILLLIYAVGLTAVVYLTRHRLQQSITSLNKLEQTAQLKSLEFTGTVTPAKEFKIAATTSAIVKEIYVDIGDRLQPNQPILRLEDLAAKQKLTQLKQQRLALQKEIDQAQQQQETAAQQTVQSQQQLAIISRKISIIERLDRVSLYLTAQSSFQQDSSQHAKAIYLQALQRERLARLYRQGEPEELKRSPAGVQAAQADLVMQAIERQRQQWQLDRQLVLLEQQQQLTATKGQLQLARLQARQAMRRLKILYQQRSLLPKESEIPVTFPVTAKAAGVVVNLPATVGDQIYTGRSLVELAQLQVLKVQVPVGTSWLDTLHLGQRAYVRVGGSAAREYEATVVTINPMPAQNMTHAVEVQFQNSQGAWLVGQAAKVRFLPE